MGVAKAFGWRTVRVPSGWRVVEPQALHHVLGG